MSAQRDESVWRIPEELTDQQRERLRVGMAALRERLAARPRPRYIRADPPPIYDDIFEEGVRALNRDGGYFAMDPKHE